MGNHLSVDDDSIVQVNFNTQVQPPIESVLAGADSLFLHDAELKRLQVVAVAISKSVVLADYESGNRCQLRLD